jgi:hypothetical protein
VVLPCLLAPCKEGAEVVEEEEEEERVLKRREAK